MTTDHHRNSILTGIGAALRDRNHKAVQTDGHLRRLAEAAEVLAYGDERRFRVPADETAGFSLAAYRGLQDKLAHQQRKLNALAWRTDADDDRSADEIGRTVQRIRLLEEALAVMKGEDPEAADVS